MHILVTGGAGYIGSHTCLQLLEQGHDVTVVDNLSNSSEVSLRRVQDLSGRSLLFRRVDICDRPGLDAVFAIRPVDAVIHFAGLKAVGESVAKPLAYYQNNVSGTLHLLEAMQVAGCKRLVFSSSATVYGAATVMPLREDAPLSATNPYGQTKLTIELILKDLAVADPTWRICCLRYFNPVGAHVSGRIGEDPNGIPNNLMPFILQVAVGRRPYLNVFGGDYPTRDGTGVRDYIHVVDLARGHLAALDRLERLDPWVAINLGTGNGSTVLEVLAGVSKAVGRDLPYQIAARRPGDAAESYADPALAQKLLGWKAELGLERMCVDGWRWQQANPRGFAGS